MSNRLLCCCVVALAACRPVDPNPTLNGMPVEVEAVDLGEVNPWVAGEDFLRLRAFVQERSTSDLRAEFAGEVLDRSQFIVVNGARTLIAGWPRTKVGLQRGPLRLFLDDELIGEWTLSRNVVDVGVNICALPGSEEGLLEQRCTRPSPFMTGAELPAVTALGPVDRRLRVTVERSSVALAVGWPGSFSARTVTVTPEQPAQLEVNSAEVFVMGRRPANPTFDPAPFSMTVDASDRTLLLTFRAGQPGARLLSVETPAGITLTTTLPLDLGVERDVAVTLERAVIEPATLRVQYQLDGARRGFQVRL